MNTTETQSGSSLQRVVRGHCVASCYLGDCQEMLPMECDAIICDPPYPDYHAEAYGYTDGLLEPLRELKCRQLIFWTAKADFPLDYTAIHIWDKKIGTGSQYERIFERNGQAHYKVFSATSPNNIVRASMVRDVVTGHPSQKPIGLMLLLLSWSGIKGTVLDPWMGSGSTGLACLRAGLNFVGIEKNPEHFATAVARLEREANQGVLL